MVSGPISQRRSDGKATAGACGLYLLLSAVFFGRGLWGHPGDRYIGAGLDPGEMIWFLEWWHYALIHAVNPFHSGLLWAPTGYNLAGSTLIPLPGIIAFPLTHWLGPIAAYNLVMLAGPALGASTFYLLCRRLTLPRWPALVGGYLFGFSPFMLAHMLGGTNLVTILFLPLAVSIVLHWLDGTSSARRTILTLAAVITAEALCSLEIVATGTLIGGFALLLAFALQVPGIRRSLLETLGVILLAYGLAAVFLTPYLYDFFAFGTRAVPAGVAGVAAAPLNLIVPPATTLLGWATGLFRFTDGINLYEIGAYAGIPLLLIVGDFAFTSWRNLQARLLIYLAVVIWVLTLKIKLQLGGRTVVALPWGVLARLPLLGNVLPERLSVFSAFVLALLAARWLSDSPHSRGLRIAAALAAVASILPNPATGFWTQASDLPAFFATGRYRQFFVQGDNIVILPYGFYGNSDLWQAATRMYFRMAGGYAGWAPPVPSEFGYFPVVPALEELSALPDPATQLKAFLAHNDIRAIVVADEGAHVAYSSSGPGPAGFAMRAFTPSEKQRLLDLFALLDLKPERVDDVLLYRIPPGSFADYKRIAPPMLALTFARQRLDTLLRAKGDYVRRGEPAESLSLPRLQELGLLPAGWITVHRDEEYMADGLFLEPLDGAQVRVGILVPEATLDSVVASYGKYAKRVNVARPAYLGQDPLETGDSLVTFDLAISRLAEAGGS